MIALGNYQQTLAPPISAKCREETLLSANGRDRPGAHPGKVPRGDTPRLSQRPRFGPHLGKKPRSGLPHSGKRPRA